MGWWKVEGGEDRLGDPPADELGLCLESIAEARAERGLGKPDLGELLAAITVALQRKARDWCGPGGDQPVRTLVARVETPEQEVEIESSGEVDPEDVLQLSAAFEGISLQYEDVLGRRPRCSELLAAVAFVLGDRPDEVLEVPEDWSVKAVTVEA